MQIQFLGGVQTVTGSKTLLTLGKHRVLVDCGLFQGLKSLRLKNWAPLAEEVRGLDAVLLTHAHLDHVGYLPQLVKGGFRRKIYCSAPTRELATLILRDSARLQVEDADFANRHGFSKHRPAEPLFTPRDVERTLSLMETVPSHRWVDLAGRIKFRLSPSGHILGSTFIEVEYQGVTTVFSGDLGRTDPILYPPPSVIRTADYLVLESTYGDRIHSSAAARDGAREQLVRVVNETLQRGGQLIVPSFAVGRVQDLLHLFAQLIVEKKIPKLPIYLDSPMGINATQIFRDYPEWHRLDSADVELMQILTHVVRTRAESIQVMSDDRPAIIIAGSGMLTGGRVLHHLVSRLPDERNTILLVGFQAAGTRGRLLREGASEVKVHGKYIPVRARIEEIVGLSAHADQAEILTWLRGFERAPQMTFINHGEPQASDALRVKIQDTLGWSCEAPQPQQVYDLNSRV